MCSLFFVSKFSNFYTVQYGKVFLRIALPEGEEEDHQEEREQVEIEYDEDEV